MVKRSRTGGPQKGPLREQRVQIAVEFNAHLPPAGQPAYLEFVLLWAFNKKHNRPPRRRGEITMSMINKNGLSKINNGRNVSSGILGHPTGWAGII